MISILFVYQALRAFEMLYAFKGQWANLSKNNSIVSKHLKIEIYHVEQPSILMSQKTNMEIEA